MNKMLLGMALSLSFLCSTQALDFATATGSDIVDENATKKRGYSSAQVGTLQERLAGRTLSFENGKVFSVSKDFNGNLSVMISFKSENAKELFAPAFTVSAKISDPATAKWVENLDEGAKIKKLTGKVDKKGLIVTFFTLVDAQIEPEVMPAAKQMFNPETVTGQDLVKGNAEKKSGYSSAQVEKIQEQLSGKVLTFENGKVFSVSKDFNGNLSVMISFKSENAKELFAPAFTVSAKISDPAMAKKAEKLDEGTKIKRLTGKVDKKGLIVTFFTLVDAQIE